MPVLHSVVNNSIAFGLLALKTEQLLHPMLTFLARAGLRLCAVRLLAASVAQDTLNP